jgi:hypothetical protein
MKTGLRLLLLTLLLDAGAVAQLPKLQQLVQATSGSSITNLPFRQHTECAAFRADVLAMASAAISMPQNLDWHKVGPLSEEEFIGGEWK